LDDLARDLAPEQRSGAVSLSRQQKTTFTSDKPGVVSILLDELTRGFGDLPPMKKCA
jgi:hypothetical protein